MLPNGFSKLVPRWKKTKQLQYSRDFTVMLIIQMLLMLMYAFFHTPSIFRAKNYLFRTLCAYAWHRLRPYLIFYTGKKKTDYTVYTDYKKQTEFLFILISPIYSQSGSVMNEQCVWRQIELDTTPVLEQGTNQYF